MKIIWVGVIGLLCTGCYSKQVRLMNNDIMTLRGEVHALSGRMDAEVERLEKKSDRDYGTFWNWHQAHGQRIVELELFKMVHDKRWPHLKELK